MLSKCANPACSVPFRRLREGKLFVVETESLAPGCQALSPARRARPLRRVEHYWLCDECARFITLAFDRERGMITVPLPDETLRKTVTMMPLQEHRPSATQPELRLVMAAAAQARGL